MKALLRTAAERAARYLADLKDRGVAPRPEALANLRRLDEPLPEHPTDPSTVIRLLDDIGSPATMASAGGRFFGFVVGGSLPAAVAASNIAAAWDQNAGIVVLSPIAARLEQVAMRWQLDLLGLPPACGVGFVTCATQANFSGLAAARHALLARRGWNVEAQGLVGAGPRPRASRKGLRRRGLVGDRRAQVAERAVRQRHRGGARPTPPPCGDGGERALPGDRRSPRARALHARVLAAGARHRGVGRAALARTAGLSRPDRAHPPARDALPGRLAGGGGREL